MKRQKRSDLMKYFTLCCNLHEISSFRVNNGNVIHQWNRNGSISHLSFSCSLSENTTETTVNRIIIINNKNKKKLILLALTAERSSDGGHRAVPNIRH